MGLVPASKSPKTSSSDMSPKTLAIKAIEQKLVTRKETKAIQSCNNPCLELFIQQVTKELLQTNSNITSVSPDNLPEESRKSLQDMEKWKDVVIRPADKISKCFVLNREDYVQRTLIFLFTLMTRIH